MNTERKRKEWERTVARLASLARDESFTKWFVPEGMYDGLETSLVVPTREPGMPSNPNKPHFVRQIRARGYEDIDRAGASRQQ